MRQKLCLCLIILVLGLCGCGGSGPGSDSGAKWTILVFMNAANNLYAASDPNVIQMQLAAGNPAVRIVVQWKQTRKVYPQSSFDGTRRYLITPGNSGTVQSTLVQNLGGGVDMGNPATLSDFIKWGMTNYPAQHFALVLWDHGNGWRTKRGLTRDSNGRAFSYDDATGNAIQIWQIPQALGGAKFDTIVWDCSLMQMAEVGYEVRANTPLVVGSEESPPATGFPYDVALGRYRDNPDATPASLAQAWVDAMNDAPGYQSFKIEESVVDTAKLAAVSSAADQLAVQLDSNNLALAQATQQFRFSVQQYDTTESPPRYFYDLTDLCKHYATTPPAGVKTAAASTETAVGNAVLYERHNANSPNSHGLSIDFSPSNAFAGYQGQYAQLDWGRANRWILWLETNPALL